MGVLGLPFGPIRGVMWLGRVIQGEVDRVRHDPGVIRGELVELDDAHRRGDIDDDEHRQRQDELVNRLWGRTGDDGP